ncbi:hypothetical protein GLOIN_2v1776887 [Rhizophagus clarus]|uniref:Uncharacterized protein n=1 Tax=Rhizophagus clarus TaxID=94130 RepID=A0A8H3L3L7_9GLOM|nr:hypothetical protein GLOIN_2v1776887 [Rhizophagus clarus]
MVNPFSIIPYKTYYYVEYHKINFIETYLVNLNNIDKIKLNEYGVELQLLPNTLFNYYSLIKHLYTRITGDCIKKWSLIKIFIEIEAILHTFDVTRHHNYFDIISELVLQSSSFIYNIKNLSLDLYDSSYGATINDINPLLKFLSSNCNSISSFYFPIFAKHRYKNFGFQSFNIYKVNESESQLLELIISHSAANSYEHLELLSLKDEVKEFRLHDIIVQNYIDLKIKSFDFLKEIMFCY